MSEMNHDDIPEWALVYARGAILCGHMVPDIEQTLVKKGLTSYEAEATVNRCFDHLYQAERKTRRRRAILKAMNRGLSLGLVAAISLLLWWQNSLEAAVRILLFFALPLACIWFSEAFGAYVGPSYMGYVDRSTPGCFVTFCGWLFLLLFGVPLLISLLGP